MRRPYVLLLPLLALLCNVAGQTTTIESISSYESCQVSGSALPATNALQNLTCSDTTGFTSIILNLKPGTGAGDIFQVNLASQNVSQSRVQGGAGLSFMPAEIRVETSELIIEYRTRRGRPLPERYLLKFGNVRPSCRIPNNERPFQADAIGDSCQRHYCCFGQCFCRACAGAYYRFAPQVNLALTGGSQIPQCIANQLRPSDAEVAFPHELAMTGPISPDAGPALPQYGGGAPYVATSGAIRVNGTLQPDPNGVLFNETSRVCAFLRSGVCTRPGPSSTMDNGIGESIAYWIMPIWTVFEIEPLPVFLYTVTATVTSTPPDNSTANATQVIQLGVVTITNQTIAANSVYNQTTGVATSTFALAGRSQDGLVTLTLLSQSVFGTVPAQEGVIVAIDDEFRPGQLLQNQQIGLVNGTPIYGSLHIPRAGFYGLGYDEGPTLPPDRALPGALPPTKWFWGRNRQNGLFYGPNCNEQGMTNTFWTLGGNADIPTSRGLFGTCVPNYDSWSSPGQFAQPMTYFVGENRRFCGPVADPSNSSQSICSNQQTPPYVPPFLWPTTWMSNGQLRWKPPSNVIATIRMQILIAGTFARLVRRLPPGRLITPANITGGPCTLAVGVGGFMFVDVQNTDTQFAGSYVVSIDCSASPGYTPQSSSAPPNTQDGLVPGVVQAGLSLQPQEIKRINFGIFLTGPNQTNARQCNINLFDSEGLSLDTITMTCNETVPFTPGGGAGGGPNNSSQEILGDSVSEGGQIAVISVAIALGIAMILCCCCIYGRQLREAGFIRRAAEKARSTSRTLASSDARFSPPPPAAYAPHQQQRQYYRLSTAVDSELRRRIR